MSRNSMLRVVFVLCNYMAEMGLGLTAGRPASQKEAHCLEIAKKRSIHRQPGLLNAYHFHTIGKQKHLHWTILSLGLLYILSWRD